MRGLNTFREDSFIQALKNFFEDLQVPVNYIADEPANAANILGDKYKPDNLAHKLIDDVYVLGMVDDAIFELQNQLFKDEWTTTRLQKIDKDYDGLVIFGVTLKQREGDLLPTRSQLAEITRAFNRAFHYTPVTVVFKYGNYIAFANSERAKYKQEWREGERVGKVTMLKDVSIEKTHSGHIRILLDMQISRSGKDAVTSFSGLYKYWQKVFNVSTLNKSFYRELSNWYFYAMKHVSFPDDLEKDENIRNATNLIRLITRVIFIWFIKEKGLVPEAIFNKAVLGKILKEFHKSKASCTYYPAILQNLFFGTLNQKMEERSFADNRGYPWNKSEFGVKNLFRYDDLFLVDKAEALSLFQDVPFLNGGLFDCLDKPDDQGKILYVDGFSRNSRKQAIVPDSLFFAEEHEIDLNEIYDTKNKKYTTKGFVEILSGYKFTVEENTPIEEEVALDPELLGKVFENLLASYNPETQTTARKQTGSFYTPREIVNYMVDESLKAYLKGVLVEESSMTEGDAQAGLDLLFAYTEKEHLFDAAETKTLISAIDRCKILDPACGSGAFPMGVLHKMVHILHKLDPNNKQWEQRQVDKVNKLIEEAQGITDTSAREQVISGLEHNKQDIEDAFGSNELDYGRKLYLIENCIYGVDIQAIAVQIAKLRFFISLVIDQKKRAGKENLGIRALPNLETKFVAANTLIGLEKLGQNLLKNQKIIKLENDLKSLRHKYFSAKTRKDKINWQKKDRALREEISKLLVNDGLDTTTAQLIVSFDPYDQNASAPFFDPEWMFGISEGFDVVIGNPPYVRADNPAISEQRVQILKSKQFVTLWEKWDLMVAFIEKSVKLLCNNGVNTFIVSNSICTSKYAEKLQDWIIANYQVRSIDYFENIEVFEAGVIPIILSLKKSHRQENTIKNYRERAFENVSSTIVDNSDLLSLKEKIFRKQFSAAFSPNIVADLMGDICYMSYGLRPNSDERFWKGEFIAKDVISDQWSEIFCKEYIEGKQISNYKINKIKFIEWGTERVPTKLVRPTFTELYTGEKLFLGVLTGGTYDNTGIICNHSIVVSKRFNDLKNVSERSISVSISKNNIDGKGSKTSVQVSKKRKELENISKQYQLKYILGIINSTYAMAFLNNFRRHRLENYFYPDDFRNFPIAKVDIKVQEQVIYFVNYLLFYNGISNNNLFSSFFESLVDAMVFELYLPDKIKSADCEILKHLANFPELKDDWSDEQKLATIEKVYKELSDPTHPVSIATQKMGDIPEIRIIEGKNK